MALQNSLQESGATTLLKRAVELDREGRLHESLISYQAGLEQLLQVLKGTKGEEGKHHLRTKVNEYMDRAEAIRKLIDEQKESGKYHEEIHIENDSCGHSYEATFGRFLDSSVTEVEVEDPYIRSHRQVCNFLRFCEMLLTSIAKIQRIKLVTGLDESLDAQKAQRLALTELTTSLQDHNVELKIEYSHTLHDREIRFSNGWIIKIGRGLDYFKGGGKYCIGSFDQSLRKCHETTINIFHRNFTKAV